MVFGGQPKKRFLFEVETAIRSRRECNGIFLP